MSELDLDDYVGWLRARGVADEHLPLYREGADAVARQMRPDEPLVTQEHIDAAVELEAAMGASPRRQANLRAIGARLQAYVVERRTLVDVAPVMTEAATSDDADGAPPGDEPLLELADVPRGLSRRARLQRPSQEHEAVDGEGRVRGTMVDDLLAAAPANPDEAAAAPMPPRAPLAPPGAPPAAAPAMPSAAVPFTDGPRPGVLASPTRPRRNSLDQPPLPGCVCRKRQETFADDYFSMWGKVYLFVAGTLGLALTLFWSRLASLAVGMTVIALGAVATALTAGWRCTDCRRWIERRGLAEDQRANQRQRMVIFLGVGAAAAIVAAISIHELREQHAREQRELKVLEDLQEFDETGD